MTTLDGVYRFIGTDGSMGLFKGNKYRLHVNLMAGGNVEVDIILGDRPIRMPGGVQFMPYLYCPYDNGALFDKNWERVK